MNNIIPIKKGSYIPDIEIKGRTLVNLLGRQGNPIYSQLCEAGNNMQIDSEVGTYVATNKVGLQWYVREFIDVTTISGRYYIGLAEIKCTTGRSYFRPGEFAERSTAYFGADEFDVFACKFIANENTKYMQIGHDNVPERPTINKNDKLYFKNLRVYEISKEEYDSYDIQDENVRRKLDKLYPYVDDAKCIVNPYIKNNQNIIADTNWVLTETLRETGDIMYWQSYELDKSVDNIATQTMVLLEPGIYSYNFEGEIEHLEHQHVIVNKYTKASGITHILNGETNYGTFELTEPTYVSLMVQYRNNNNDVEGIKKIFNSFIQGNSKASLVRGNTPKKYDECHNSRIMFETNLYSDEAISRRNDGVYIKNSKWEQVTLGGSSAPEFHATNPNSSKQVRFENITLPRDQEKSILIRYDGKIIKPYANINEKEEGLYYSIISTYDKNVYMSLPNNLTGWGDNYTPTADEIKAFFLGWSMMSESGAVYNDASGASQKVWRKLWCGIGNYFVCHSLKVFGTAGDSNYTLVCPTSMNDQGYTPYKLIYRKNDLAVCDIKTYGSLIINDGEYDVMAGSGLILCDKVIPFLHGNKNYIGGASLVTNVSNRISNVLKVYDKDGNILHHANIGRATTAGAIVGGDNQATYNTMIDNDLTDYILYSADTVRSFEYNLSSLKSVNDMFNTNAQNIVNCLEELSKTKKELELTKRELLQLSNPNLLINGDFQVWQRGNSFNITKPYTYTSDRWRSTGNATGIISRVYNGIKIIKTSDTEELGIEQIIEENDAYTNFYRNKIITVSCKIDGVVYTITRNLNDTNGVTLNFLTPNMKLYTGHLNNKGGAVAITFTDKNEHIIEYIKMETGSFASPFIPRLYAEELALCQRYYEIVKRNNITGLTIYTNGRGQLAASFKVDKRIVPTMSKTTGINIHYMGLATQKQITADYARHTIYGCRFDISTLSPTTTTEVGRLIVVEDDIAFDAEIY